MSSLSYVKKNLNTLLQVLSVRVREETQVTMDKLLEYSSVVSSCGGVASELTRHSRESQSHVSDAHLYGYVHALSLNATIHGEMTSLVTLTDSVVRIAPALTECLEKLREVFPSVDKEKTGEEKSTKSIVSTMTSGMISGTSGKRKRGASVEEEDDKKEGGKKDGGKKDGDEAAVDCGGSCAKKCAISSPCSGDSDCESYVGSCVNGVLTDADARTKHNQCPGPRGAVKRPYKRFPQ